MTTTPKKHRRRSDISIGDLCCAWGLTALLVAALVLL
jgi:hypothetical protein